MTDAGPCESCNHSMCIVRRADRRQVVEWLRAPHQVTANIDRRTLSWAADAIERGDHRISG